MSSEALAVSATLIGNNLPGPGLAEKRIGRQRATKPGRILAAPRTPRKVNCTRRRTTGGTCIRPVSGLASGSQNRLPVHRLPGPFAHVMTDATWRSSDWLLRGGEAVRHLDSLTVAGAAGALRRIRYSPRTPFPFNPSAMLNGHLLHCRDRPKASRYYIVTAVEHSTRIRIYASISPLPSRGASSRASAPCRGSTR